MIKWLKFIFGILVSIILIYLIFQKVNLSSVITILKNIDIGYTILAFILGFLLIFLRSYRWRLFIKEYSKHGILNFYEATNVGLMFNYILPFRAGDLVQAFLLSKKTVLPKSLTFSTVLMERFIDLFPPIIFIILGSFFIILPKEISMMMSIIMLICLVSGMWILLKIKSIILHFFSTFSEKFVIFSKISNVILNFYSVIENLKKPDLLIKVVPLTFILWSGYSTGVFLCTKALRLNLPSFFAAYLVQGITSLSVAIPSSPGYVGSWEFMGILSLKLFNVGAENGLAFALLLRITGMIPILLVGSLYVAKEFSLIRKVSKENSNT